MNSCRLIFLGDFIVDMENLISTLVKNDSDPNDRYSKKEITLMFIKGILEIKEKYNTEDFEDSVNEYLSDKEGYYLIGDLILDGFDYLNDLKDIDYSVLEEVEVLPKESKTDSFDRTFSLGLFLLKYFVQNSTSKLFLLNNFKNKMARALFINSDEELFNMEEAKTLTSSIVSYLSGLVNDIYAALNNSAGKATADTFRVEWNLNPISALSYAGTFFNKTHKSTIARIPLLKEELTDSRDILAKGYMAWVILSNFDKLIKELFGKAVIIKNPGQFDSAFVEDKYSINTGDRNTTTWRAEDRETDETEELSSLPILFIESLNMYKNGNKLSRNMQFSQVKSAIGVIAKVLEMKYNPYIGDSIITILKNEYSDVYGKEQLNTLLNDYVIGKTINEVYASAKMTPSLMPIFFRLLLPMITSEGVKIATIKYTNSLEKGIVLALKNLKDVIESLYRNIFSPDENSIFTKNLFAPNLRSIYNYMIDLFLNIENKPQMEYEEDIEGLKITSLSDKNTNERRKLYSYQLEGKYNKVNPITFRTFSIENDLDHKKIDIKYKDFVISVSGGNTVTITKGGDTLGALDIDINQFKSFLSEVLEIDVDDNLLLKFGETYKTNSEVDLIKLAAHILYHYLVGKKMFSVKNNLYETEAQKYYEIIPSAQKLSILPALIARSDFQIFKGLSEAKDVVDGYSEVNTVKDGARKSLSTLGLSALVSKTGEIFANEASDSNSPINHLSFYDMYLGFELMRDYSGFGETKEAKKFSIAELAAASFIHDMYGDLYEYNDDGTLNEKEDGILRIMGPIVSDKTNLIKLKYGWNSKLPNGTLLRNATIGLLKDVIQKDFGEYYLKVYKYIKSQFEIVNRHLPEGCIIPFNYDSNFKEANEAYGQEAAKILHLAIFNAQLAGEDVEIIDLVSYIGNSTIQNNPSLFHLMSIFGVLPDNITTSLQINESSEAFWHRKELQLVSDFLRGNVELKIYDGNQLRKGISYQVAEMKNRVLGEDGKTVVKSYIKGQYIIPAILQFGEYTYKLATKYDLIECMPYNRMMREIESDEKSQSLKKFLDINSPDFDFERTLAEIKERSIRWNALNSIDKIAKLSPFKNFKSLSKAELLQKAELLYKGYMTSRGYSAEDLNERWNQKLKLDLKTKELLVEYVTKNTIRDYINTYYNDPMAHWVYEELGYPEVNDVLAAAKITATECILDINPEIIKHNLFDFYLEGEFTLATTGTYVSHPTKENSSISAREAALFGQAIKRYVSYTASKHREQANQLDGISEDLNIAVIDDKFATAFGLTGKGKTKPFDGATFYGGTMNYLDNNSLGGDAMGIDKKPFCHHLGRYSGIGFILKTAGFPMTNERIRTGDKVNRVLNKHMLDIKWDSSKVLKIINPNWNSTMPKQIPDWTKDYFNRDIDYGEFYVYNPTEKLWYVRKVENGVPVQAKYGETEFVPYTLVINSNYDLWQFFGGEYSGHLTENGLTYINDNSSFERLTQALNMVGIRKYADGKVLDLSGVNQVLKKAQIHMFATAGAIKYGGANINTAAAYENPNYPVTYMTIKAYDIGEQLDAEHSAEDENVALMTLVMNALGARGYTYEVALECYEALAAIADVMNKDGLEGLMVLNNPNLSPEEKELGRDLLKNSLAELIYLVAKRANNNDNDMFNALVGTLEGFSNKTFSWDDISGKFPISHPAIFQKMISSIASGIEKSVKLKFEGNMLVLNPSEGRFTIINGHLSGYYYDHPEELDALENEYVNNPIKISDLKVGFNYKNINTGEYYLNITPHLLLEIKNSILNGESFLETVKDSDGNPLGHDLAAYQVSFLGTDGESYNSWEIDCIRLLHDFEDGGFLIPSQETEADKAAFLTRLLSNWNKLDSDLKAYNAAKFPSIVSLLTLEQLSELDELSYPEEWDILGVDTALLVKLQESLNALSENSSDNEVIIDGQSVTVDKSTIQVAPYEAILPMMYKNDFGLKEGDIIQEIVDDKLFFVRRAILNIKPKIKNSALYDIELKSLSGNHIYLGYTLPDENTLYDNLDKVEFSIEHDTEFDGDTLYRVDVLGNRLHSIPYTKNPDGSISTDVQIFKDPMTGQEILYSKNLSYFLDSFNYVDIVFGENTKSDKIEVLKQLNLSSSKVAKRKVENITKIVNKNYAKRYLKLFKGKDRDIVASLFKALIDSDEKGELESIFEVDYSFEDILETPELSENAVWYVTTLHDYYYNKLDELELELGNEGVENKYSLFRGLLNSGKEIHTSFLASLEHVVSRTPALSLLSFMAMKVAAFTNETTNTAYVGKNLLLYQGSDYDIDKVSILGLKFKNGKLVSWSPYFDLSSAETFEASKKLPFPTGKLLDVKDVDKIPYEVLVNNLRIIPNENILTITTPNNLSISIVPDENNGVRLLASDWENTSALDRYILIRRAALEIGENPIVFTNFEIPLLTRRAIGLSGDNVLTGVVDINADFEEFNLAIFPIDFNINSIKLIKSDIIRMAPNLGVLIRVYNKLGGIPELMGGLHLYIKSLVDAHNLHLKGKDKIDALRNFISIKAKDISKNPINQILALAAIDNEVAKLELILKNPKFLKLSGTIAHVDRGSIYSKYFMQTLTLAGKDNVGIEASSLKNFEAMSLYNYQVLNSGSAEEQERLLFDININGYHRRLLANANTKNNDTIKSENVLEALDEVDNNSDAFLVKSALLSSATDNTKNPILPKLNAGPEMLSLYNAGVIIGIPVTALADLILSDTGLLLSDITKSNVFSKKLGKSRVELAISYLENAPTSSLPQEYVPRLLPLFLKLGIVGNQEKFNKSNLAKILETDNLNSLLLRVFKFLLNPSEDATILKINEEDFVRTLIKVIRGSEEYKLFGRVQEAYEALVAKGDNLTPEEKETLATYTEYKLNRDIQLSIINDLNNWLKTKNSNSLYVLDLLDKYKKLESVDIAETLKKLKLELWADLTLKNSIEEISNWLRYRNTYKNDLVVGADGKDHVVLYLLKKLTQIALEQSALRPLMALNQGIPNKYEDLLSFLNHFGNIISERLKFISEKRRNELFGEENELELLLQLNVDLGILNPNPYYVDLNSFIYNSAYNRLVKNIYNKIKCITNIFEVADNVAHYKKYLLLMNLTVQKNRLSAVYRAILGVNDVVIPKMLTQKKAYIELMLKNALQIIYRKLNKKYLLSKKASYKIPNFKVMDTEIEYDEPRTSTTIILGTKNSNLKFKEWFQYIEFPRLLEKYPDNAFIRYLGYRMYDYNDDHNLSSNLAKIKLVNNKNLTEQVEFDLAKQGLSQLLSSEIESFFYYNLIAYNNSPGLLSLTSLFEDAIVENYVPAIKDYNTYMASIDESEVFDWNDKQTVDALIRDIAPVVSTFDVKWTLRIPFIYVKDKNTNKTYLCIKDSNAVSSEDDELFDQILSGAGYRRMGKIAEALTNFSMGKYALVPDDNLNAIRVYDGDTEYSVKQLIKLSKEPITASKIIIRKKDPKTKTYNYDLKAIESRIDKILNKNTDKNTEC